MAHKTASDARRMRSKRESSSPEEAKSEENLSGEITGRFVGVDETDRAALDFSKIHILKTRSSSEQNLMLKTSSLRKGKYLSSSLIYDDSVEGNQKESDKLNNNVREPPNKLEISVTVSIQTNEPCYRDTSDTILPKKKCELDSQPEIKQTAEPIEDKECEDLCDLIKAVNNAHVYKKNSNVYNVFQAKTVLSERRRSLPLLPKLIGQKLTEHAGRTLPRSAECPEPTTGNKDFKLRTFRTLSRGLGRLLKRHSSINITEPDPVYKVAYLGNVLTGWAKGEGCVDKPLATLWRNYSQSSKPDVVMKLSITNSGLKGVTKEHGLTEYWAHRITYCASPPEFPKVFCWVYRHEGRKLKHELRCHAVLCTKDVSKKIATDLQFKIKQALFEFKRDKISRQNARLSLANSVYDNPSMPRRKILLSVGGNNYKPPLERSKSAPKLMSIEEMCSEEDEEEMTMNVNRVERTTNTWTKDISPHKMCCQPDDIFPSYTLGRRKCDKKCYRKSVPENRFKKMEPTRRLDKCDNDLTKREVATIESAVPCGSPTNCTPNEDSKDTCDETYSYSSHLASSTNHVSFSFSVMSDISENNLKEINSDDAEDDVFYCETDERLSSIEETRKESDEGGSMNGMEQLCAPTNFLVLDSDEGSISSGCETASTVTSSDIEMTSLPCNFSHGCPQESEKISVLERVQSFEQLFSRERNHSTRNFRSLTKRNLRHDKRNGSFRTTETESSDADAAYSSPGESLSYSPSIDSGSASCGDEVNLVPLGEKQNGMDIRRTYIRCATYPPSDDEANISSFDSREYDSSDVLGGDARDAADRQHMNFDSETKTEIEKTEGDSDSACSVESGYSELSDGGHNECVIGNTVCV